MDTQKQDYTLADIIENTFDFSDYSESDKQDMITETAGLVMEAALIQSLEKAGDSVQSDFEAFMQTDPDDEKMNEYILKNVPNFQDYVVSELKVLKEMGTETDTE